MKSLFSCKFKQFKVALWGSDDKVSKILDPANKEKKDVFGKVFSILTQKKQHQRKSLEETKIYNKKIICLYREN